MQASSATLILSFLAGACALPPQPTRMPNFVLVFADDQGYGDLGCFGSDAIRTPNIDRMAREGMRFTSFYAQTVCGPSRAALMTGCYPLRVAKKENRVDIHPYLHSEEITIAEVLRVAGYKTGCFGKWDLAGHRQRGYAPELLPLHQGFDVFFGTPTSNDSVVHLIRGNDIVEKKADMSMLTERYTTAAIEFMREHRDHPFFVYIPHTMPHTKLAASPKYRGKSKRGLYGDVIEEIDGNVGRILDTLKELELAQHTYVIYTSDNGPWWIKKEHGGSAGPLRGAKTSSFEGGVRVPCVVWAPGRVPTGRVCDEIASTMDFMPTLAALAGTSAPTDRVIDGHDIRALLRGDVGAKSPTKRLFHYVLTRLQAVRVGRYKLHAPRPAKPRSRPDWSGHIAPADRIAIDKPMLFDLDQDIGEKADIAAEHPDVVARLMEHLEWARREIGDESRVGAAARFFDPQPRRPDIKQ